MAVAATSNAHEVTEKELPQYVDYVISKFDLRSFTVSHYTVNICSLVHNESEKS